VRRARLVLAACTALVALGAPAGAWGAPAPDDGGARSGGARALPVVPSHGGSSEALPDESSGLPVTPVVPQPPPVLPAPDGVPTAAQASGSQAETTLDESDIVVPLAENDDTAPSETRAAAAQAAVTDDGSGSLPFTGLALVSLVVAGLGLLLAGLTLRRS
jgi:hypothetical protein